MVRSRLRLLICLAMLAILAAGPLAPAPPSTATAGGAPPPLPGPAGIAGQYTAATTPPTATVPLLTWDNGTTGAAASYTWAETGRCTLTVTATNACGALTATYPVSVFCQPLLGVKAAGPQTLVVGQEGTYFPQTDPLTASRPLTVTWSNGATGPSAAYSWTMTGTYTVSLAATNACAAAPSQDSMAVQVIAA
jgi:hypothetical protein